MKWIQAQEMDTRIHEMDIRTWNRCKHKKWMQAHEKDTCTQNEYKHKKWIQAHEMNTCAGNSGGRYPGFLIEWIFYWIESSQIKNFEWIFELNFLGKKIIE